MLTLAVTYVFPEVHTERAEGHLRELIAASRREPGCRTYEVFRAVETPRRFFIFEQYDDEAALDAHRASAHFERAGKNGIQPIAESRDAALYRAFA